MQFAKINNVTLHYQTIGAPEGKPLMVFVNSLGTDFRIWRDIIVRFVGDFAMLTYDKRGHGLSDIGQAPYTLEDHVNDLAGLMDMLGQKNAIIVGLSVGGIIAQSLASRRPDLVSALVLCDTGAKIGTAALWNQRIEAIEAKGMDAVADNIMERWFSPAFRENEKDAVSAYRNMVTRQTKEGYTGTCAVLRDTDLTEIAATLPVPTSCLVGENDIGTPPSMVMELAKLIPGARYDVIPRAGHLPCVEEPVIMADIIRAFADSLK